MNNTGDSKHFNEDDGEDDSDDFFSHSRKSFDHENLSRAMSQAITEPRETIISRSKPSIYSVDQFLMNEERLVTE